MNKLSAITECVIDKGASCPSGGSPEQEVAGVAPEDPVVVPSPAPGARVEDLVGEVGGGQARSQPRGPRVHRPVTREEPRAGAASTAAPAIAAISLRLGERLRGGGCDKDWD